MPEEGFPTGQKTLFFIIAILVITGVIFFFFVSIFDYEEQIVHIPDEVIADIVSLRFTNIEECLAYQDPVTLRVYPGVIDLARFNDNTMLECYPPIGQKTMNFGLKLKGSGLQINTANYRQGPSFTIFRRVLIKEENKFTEDTLSIFVELPNA